MTELSDLSRRNDELQSEKDNDFALIRELEGQVKEYKRKYEQAKTELRSAKGTFFQNCMVDLKVHVNVRVPATSQLFLKPPKIDDQLPVARDEGLVDALRTALAVVGFSVAYEVDRELHASAIIRNLRTLWTVSHDVLFLTDQERS